MYSNTLSTVFLALTHVAVFISSQDLSSKNLKVAGKSKKELLSYLLCRRRHVINAIPWWLSQVVSFGGCSQNASLASGNEIQQRNKSRGPRR